MITIYLKKYLIREKIEKWILKKLFEYNCLVFESWRSDVDFEFNVRVLFMGKEIKKHSWSILNYILDK